MGTVRMATLFFLVSVCYVHGQRTAVAEGSVLRTGTGQIITIPPPSDCWAYTNVANTERLYFMCHNLGADPSVDPFGENWFDTNVDTNGSDIKGDLYQWGRQADGHEKRDSGITYNQATDDAASNIDGQFVIDMTDWRSGGSDGLWGATKGPNDPCPPDFRVPTESEWQSIHGDGTNTNTWDWTDNGYKVGSNLFLPAAGFRNATDGVLFQEGIYGYYWSANESGSIRASYLRFHLTFVVPSNIRDRSYGHSVRCVAE